MNLKYNKQLLIATTMQDINESDQIINIVNKGIKQGVPTEFLYLGNLEADLYRGNGVPTITFIEKYAKDSIIPGTVKFFQDTSSSKIIQASKSINGRDIEIIEHTNIEQARKDLSKKLLDAINKLDNNSRLYVVGHGSPGGVNFSRELGRTALSYNDLASIIASNPKLKQMTNAPILVSLISCSAGVESSKNKSSAHLLSKLLAQRGVYAKVSGANGILSLDPLPWTASKYVNDIHHGESQKKYYETNPKNNITIARFKVYNDNMTSVLNANEKLETLHNQVLDYERKFENDSTNPIMMAEYKKTRGHLASLAYDLISDRNYSRSIGADFDEINKIRWEDDSELKSSKIYYIAKELLQKDISYCLLKDQSLTKSLESSFESIQSQVQFYKYLPNNEIFNRERYFLKMSYKTLIGNITEQNERLSSSMDIDTLDIVSKYANHSSKKILEKNTSLVITSNELKRDLFRDIAGNVSKFNKPEITRAIDAFCKNNVYDRTDSEHREFYKLVAKNRALTALKMQSCGIKHPGLSKIIDEIYEAKQTKSVSMSRTL